MFKFLTQGAKLMKIRSPIIALATLAVLAACNHHTRAEQLHR